MHKVYLVELQRLQSSLYLWVSNTDSNKTEIGQEKRGSCARTGVGRCLAQGAIRWWMLAHRRRHLTETNRRQAWHLGACC